jgi:glutamate-ammonia-ligase adenylyltransferase
MRDNHASKNENEFDIKQDEGGIIDVEFIVQYLVLGHAHAYPELCSNLGNIALLGIAAELGLIPLELADEVRNAYREYRRMQHANRIDGRPSAGIDKTLISERIGKVRALWKVVFE